MRKEVGLVLDGVLGSCQKGSAVNIFSCCVMACGDAVVAFTPLVDEGTELNHSVAHHVGVGREAFADRIDGVAHHVVPILLVQVDLLEAAAVFLGNEGRNLDILFRRAVNVALFVLHTDADIEDVGRVALLLEQMYHD